MKKLFLLTVLFCLPSPYLLADAVSGLYETIVEVDDESPEARNKGMKLAVHNVLLKVSGRQSPALKSSINKNAKELVSYVQEYRYVPLSADALTQQETPVYRLKVVFDARSLKNWLNKNQLPVWSEQRPVVLLWSATQSAGKRTIDVAEFDAVLADTVDSVRQTRGVSFVLPLMDLQDRGALLASDIWGQFDDRILTASQRYSTDMVVTVSMSQISKNQWQANWRRLFASSVETWTTSGKSRTSVLNKGLNELVDRMADQFSKTFNAQENEYQLVQVSGVFDMSGYNRLIKFLLTRDAISKVEAVRVDSSSVLLALSLTSSLDKLKNELRLGGLVRQVQAPEANLSTETKQIVMPVDNTTNTLYYQLEE